MAHQEIIRFYEKYRRKLYNIALRITGDSLDAEDVVQDTVIKYLRSSTGKLADQQVEAWLCKACVRASVDMLRVRKAGVCKGFSGYVKGAQGLENKVGKTGGGGFGRGLLTAMGGYVDAR